MVFSLKTLIEIVVDRDIIEGIRGLSQRHGAIVSDLAEKLFSELANKAEIIEDRDKVSVMLRDSVIKLRRGGANIKDKLFSLRN